MATAVVPMVAGATAPLTLAQQQIAQHGFAFDKYQVALQKYDLIGEADPSDQPTVTMMFDDLLTFLFAEFDLSGDHDELVKQCKWLLDDSRKDTGKTSSQLLRETPSPVIEAMWPVALVKAVLCEHKARINTRTSHTFDKFAKAYINYILG